MTIELHPAQWEVYNDLYVENNHDFGAARCARGFGKSYLGGAGASTSVFELMALDYSVPNKNVFIIAPTYDQVKDIYYPLLAYEFGLEQYAYKYSRDLGRFVFANNVELRLMSYEAVERMRGKGAYHVVWDEITSCTKGITAKEAWEGIIQPCIITRWPKDRSKQYGARRSGSALIISTPKGYDHFYDMCNYHEQDERWISWHFDYRNSPYIDPDEVERIKHQIDPIQFASEYMATFEESGYQVFYCFDRNVHVRDDLEDFEDDEIVHACIDFNVGIQATSFFALRGNQMHFLYEFMGHPDTETLASAMRATWEDNEIRAYPDPSGRAKKTSSPTGRTDFSILQSFGIKTFARQKAPPIMDSVNAVNAKLMNASGDVGIFIHPRCVNLIKTLERTKWVDNNPNLAAIDKSEGVEHFSDGVRYGVEYLFPVRAGKKTTARGFNF